MVAGAYSCLGKNLALTELRTLTATVFMDFNVSFAPSEDGSRLLQESKDHFTMSLAPLDLVFTPLRRQQSFGVSFEKVRWGGGSGSETRRGLRQNSALAQDTIPEEESLQSWTW